MPAILILRLSSLGDVVLTTPILRALRERYPNAEIDLALAKEYESLAPLLPGISKVHVFDKRTGIRGLLTLRRKLKEENYEYVLDLHNVLRTRILRRGVGKHVSVIHKRSFRRWLLIRFKSNRLKHAPDVVGRYFETARLLGVMDSGSASELNVAGFHDFRRFAIAPGSRHWNKRWPRERFTVVANELIARGYHIDIHGSAADCGVAEQIARELPAASYTNFTGVLNLADVAREIANATAILTNDSGLMHVAEAVGTRIIALFGPTVTAFGFKPRAKDAIVLESEGLYCRPCTANGLERCPEKHFRCMMEIEPKEVIEQISLLSLNMSPGTKS